LSARIKRGEFISKIKKPLKKLLTTIGVRALYSLPIAVFISLFFISLFPFLSSKEMYDTVYSNYVLICLVVYLYTFTFISMNVILDYFAEIMDIFIETFGNKKTQDIFNKEFSATLTLSQRRYLSNILKWLLVGFLAAGTMSAVLLIQQSVLGFPTDANLAYLFGVTYFIGILIVTSRKILMRNVDWVLVSLDDFIVTHKPEHLKRALLSYNKWLGACLSLRKLLFIVQNVSQAYKIATEDQKNALNEQIHKISVAVNERNISIADSEIILLAQKAKDITAIHKSFLGMSVKYPFKVMLWEQTKVSLTKNYSKIMYLFLGITVFVILDQFHLLPTISLP
jgi:hypothetical protein